MICEQCSSQEAVIKVTSINRFLCISCRAELMQAHPMAKEALELVTESLESIKLIKNTKGYNWELKLIGADVNRLYAINEELLTKFGQGG